MATNMRSLPFARTLSFLGSFASATAFVHASGITVSQQGPPYTGAIAIVYENDQNLVMVESGRSDFPTFPFGQSSADATAVLPDPDQDPPPSSSATGRTDVTASGTAAYDRNELDDTFSLRLDSAHSITHLGSGTTAFGSSGEFSWSALVQLDRAYDLNINFAAVGDRSEFDIDSIALSTTQGYSTNGMFHIRLSAGAYSFRFQSILLNVDDLLNPDPSNSLSNGTLLSSSLLTVNGKAAPVPLPPAVWGGALLLGAVATRRRDRGASIVASNGNVLN